jgi:prolyl-tRNA editing enzyme YbaK/EbsC (Cys-tRNA(Pro) deacylase)
MLSKIREWLKSNDIQFREVHHEPTKTSEESAKARGEDISIGGKCLVLKLDDNFKAFVLSAAKKLNSNALKEQFGVKKSRFATPEELLELTGLVPGSVPPFGQPILNLELYVDESITKNEKIAFNAASLTDSIIMSVPDYLKVAKPIKIFKFSED